MQENSNKQIRIGTILTYISLGVGIIVNLLYTPIMIKILGQSEYGVYNLSSSIVAYLGILNFGFGSTYIRFYSKYKVKNDYDNIARLNGIFILIFSVISIISLIAGIVLSTFSASIYGDKFTANEIEIGRILLIILSINIGIKFPNIVFSAFITSNERFIFLKIIDLIRNIMTPFLILPLLLLGFGSVGIALTTTIISLAIEISYIVYSFKKLNMNISFSGLEIKQFKEVFVFSFFIFVNIVVDQINWNVDKFILGRYHGSIIVAIYSLSTFFNTQYIQISTSISSLFAPRIHRFSQEEGGSEKVSDIFIKVGRIQYMLLLILLSGFIYFGKFFIKVWAGYEYEPSYYIIIILISAITIDLIQNLAIEIMRAYNKQVFRTIVYASCALVNILISIPLAMRYQGVGAAIGTAGSVLVGNGIIMNIYYSIALKLDIKMFWINIMKISLSLLPTFFVGYILTLYLNVSSWSGFIIACLTYAGFYVANIWMLSVNKYEKQLIHNTINLLLRRRKNNDYK